MKLPVSRILHREKKAVPNVPTAIDNVRDVPSRINPPTVLKAPIAHAHSHDVKSRHKEIDGDGKISRDVAISRISDATRIAATPLPSSNRPPLTQRLTTTRRSKTNRTAPRPHLNQGRTSSKIDRNWKKSRPKCSDTLSPR